MPVTTQRNLRKLNKIQDLLVHARRLIAEVKAEEDYNHNKTPCTAPEYPFQAVIVDSLGKMNNLEESTFLIQQARFANAKKLI